MSDLGDILARAGMELGGQTGPMDDGALRRVVSGARRRRVRRHTFQGVAAVAAVVVIGASGWWGAQREQPMPAHTPTPAVTRTTAPTPTPTSEPTPTVDAGPVVRETSTDDATVLRRLAAPRTGETWHDPEPAPDAPALMTVNEGESVLPALRVGTRGDATIYAVIQQSFYWDSDVLGLFEVDGAGARFIACPTPRADDPCLEGSYGDWRALAPGVSVDRDTFYDTLGIPGAVDLGGGYVVRTATTLANVRSDVDAGPGVARLGNAWPVAHAEWGPTEVAESVLVAGYGRAGLAEVRSEAVVPGLTPMFYAWKLPFGSTIQLSGADVPGGDFNSLVWDDGVERDVPEDQMWGGIAGVTAPAAPSCTPYTLNRDASFDRSTWRAAGRTAEGLRVYVPVVGGNDRSRQVRAWNESQSWAWGESTGEEITGAEVYQQTGFGTDQAFLDAHALVAVERPDHTWLLGMIPTAAPVVYECA